MTVRLPTAVTCPCDTASPPAAPAFVGNDYFCESGLHSEWFDSQHNGVSSFPMMFSGMVRTVHPVVHAVSSITLHGLQRTCLLRQLMILK